jgi:hypothetical protein
MQRWQFKRLISTALKSKIHNAFLSVTSSPQKHGGLLAPVEQTPNLGQQ